MGTPAQPVCVLRGHTAQIHAIAFVRDNERLATADADGYVILWDLTTKRPRAVWRPHENAILGIASWGADKIVTHGRDHRLIAWKLNEDDEDALSTTLPLENTNSPYPSPWVVHIIEVNTMNFCSFALCSSTPRSPSSMNPEELLIAVPNTLTSESVDIFHLPSQHRRHTIHPPHDNEKNGMVMTLALCWSNQRLNLIAGYENGLAIIWQLTEANSWATTYKAQIHIQPILSLDVQPEQDYFLSSGADGLIIKHPIPNIPSLLRSSVVGRASPVFQSTSSVVETGNAGRSNLSSSNFAPPPEMVPHRSHSEILDIITEGEPIKVVNTRHSGQQGLRIRSDGRIFATAGWDSRIRVYSTRNLKELAVLKWHRIGCYTVAFATIRDQATADADLHNSSEQEQMACASVETQAREKGLAVATKLVEVSVKERRVNHAKTAHWLAAGSKDGKISLWDVY